jgi:hypothetical protein
MKTATDMEEQRLLWGGGLGFWETTLGIRFPVCYISFALFEFLPSA